MVVQYGIEADKTSIFYLTGKIFQTDSTYKTENYMDVFLFHDGFLCLHFRGCIIPVVGKTTWLISKAWFFKGCKLQVPFFVKNPFLTGPELQLPFLGYFEMEFYPSKKWATPKIQSSVSS